MEHTYTPPELNFENSMLTPKERYSLIKGMLEEYECVVDFIKRNGERRLMSCTLREDHLPVASAILKDDIVDVDTTNYETITVWSTENRAWRAIKTLNVNSVILASKKWTITVEEDPETGELILPLPEDLLVTQGWNDGDVLEWTDNKDGSWSLSKSK